MSEELKHIDIFFRNSLEITEEQPPEKVWGMIEKDLDQGARKQNIILFYRLAASIALLITVGFGYFMFKNQADPVLTKTTETSEIYSSNKQAIEKNVPLPKTENTPSDRTKNTTQPEPPEAVTPYNYLMPEENNPPSNIKEDINMQTIAPKEYILATNYQNNKIKLTGQYIASELNSYNNIFIHEQTYDADKKDLIWALGGKFSPVIAKNDIEIKNLTYENVVNNYSNSEEELFAYTGGISVNLETGKRFSVQSGIYYSRNGQQINNIGIYEPTSFASSSALDNYRNSGIINTSSGQLVTEPGTNYYSDNLNNNTGNYYTDFEFRDETSYEDNIIINPGETLTTQERVVNAVHNYNSDKIAYHEIIENINSPIPLNPSNDINNTFEYIEIPVIIKYKIIEQKIGIQVLSGLSTNLLVNNRIFYYSKTGEKIDIPDANNFSQFNYSSIFGLGFEYPLVPNLIFSFEPSFKYSLNPINNDNLTNSYPYSFAFYSGISYKF